LSNVENDIFERDASLSLEPFIFRRIPIVKFHQESISECVPFVLGCHFNKMYTDLYLT